jgi:hypothetical protein
MTDESTAITHAATALSSMPRRNSGIPDAMTVANAQANARMEKATAARLVQGKIWGKETLTEAEAGVLIEMHRYYGLDPAQDHIIPMGGKAYFTADAYRYRAQANEDFAGIDMVRLDSLREALGAMDLDTRAIYIRQLAETSLGLISEAYAEREPDEIAYAAIVKRRAGDHYHYSVGIGRATAATAVSAEKVAEHAQTRAVRRALREAYRIDFPGVDEASMVRLDDFQAQAKVLPSPALSSVTMPYGNSKGKRPDELTVEDLRWYAQAFEKAMTDSTKAKYKGSNTQMRDACVAELARREVAAKEAAAAQEQPARRATATKTTTTKPAAATTTAPGGDAAAAETKSAEPSKKPADEPKKADDDIAGLFDS